MTYSVGGDRGGDQCHADQRKGIGEGCPALNGSHSQHAANGEDGTKRCQDHRPAKADSSRTIWISN